MKEGTDHKSIIVKNNGDMHRGEGGFRNVRKAGDVILLWKWITPTKVSTNC